MSGSWKNNKLKKSFTLIELLLAITIFAVIASVIYSSFRLGTLSWRRIESDLSKYQRIRYALNSMSNDLANAFAHKEIQFLGEEKRIEFAGLIKTPNTNVENIGKISYFFLSDAEGETGRLMRQSLLYWQVKAEELAEEVEEPLEIAEADEGDELLSNVLDFSLGYCYNISEDEGLSLDWQPDWTPEDVIPAGVKIKLVLKDEDSPGGEMIFAKRIFVPSGEIGVPEEQAP